MEEEEQQPQEDEQELFSNNVLSELKGRIYCPRRAGSNEMTKQIDWWGEDDRQKWLEFQKV